MFAEEDIKEYPMTKDEEIAQIKHYSELIEKECPNLSPNVKQKMKDIEKMIIESVIAESEYNPV